jgi:histidine triad (HIT) family protein
VFCRIIKGEVSAHVVHESERTLAFLDINPSAPGHTLIIPKAHIARVENLKEEDAEALFRTLHRLIGPIQKAVKSPSSTIGINNGPESGQEISHVHIHVIPRFGRDSGGIIQEITGGGRRPDSSEMGRIAERIRLLALDK